MAASLGSRFWTVWSAGAVSSLGDGIALGAMPLLAVSLTRDARLVSLVDAMAGIGWLVLGVLSGVVIDRVHRLQLMWRIDLLRAAVTAILAFLVLSGHPTLAILYGYALLIGLVRPFFDTASSTVTPQLVDADQLHRANSATQLSLVLGANLVGPPLGTWLFLNHQALPFLLDATSFLVGAVLLAVMAHRVGEPRPTVDPAPLREQVRAGLSYLIGEPILRTLNLVVALVNMVLGGMIAILVLYVLDVLNEHQRTYGWLVSAFALGGIIGAALAPRLTARIGAGRASLAALSGFAGAALMIGAVPTLPALVVALLLAGCSSVTWNVVTISYRQRTVPAELLGRVTSAYRMVALLAVPLGAAAAGMLAHALGLAETYLIGGTLLALTAVFTGHRLLQMPDADEDSAARRPLWTAPVRRLATMATQWRQQ